MKILVLVGFVVIMSVYSRVEAQNSMLDVISHKFQIAREVIFKFLTPTSESTRNLRLAEQLGILQPRVNENIPFPCALNITRSKKRPKSVHALRPGDIDVIAAIGDSVIAGNGLVATNVFQVFVQNRGISATIGGQENWRRYLTLPNILKEFNPHLIGYSVKDTVAERGYSELNVANASTKSSDVPAMALELIRRVKNDPRINFTTDWKMVTVLIGANNFCNEMCKLQNPQIMVEQHRKDLREMLGILRENLPRTFVNLIIAPTLRFLRNTSTKNKPLVCYITEPYLCPCLFSPQIQNRQNIYDKTMLHWQNAEAEVANESGFDKNDFTVVAQPFARGLEISRTKEGLTDYSFLSQDCFHPSQKANAEGALSLWNNLLEPVGRKSTTPTKLFTFKCPTERHPFIFTRRNSGR